MIGSMIVKRLVLSQYDMMNRGDVDSMMASWADDAVYDSASGVGAAVSVKGKKAIAEWHRRYLEDFPKLKFTIKSICIREAFPLLSALIGTSVIMTEWSLAQTDKDGRESKYGGITVSHVKRMKAVYVSEYVSFKGLPQLFALMKESGKA
jgi:ketosteroid isomerase-like protein